MSPYYNTMSPLAHTHVTNPAAPVTGTAPHRRPSSSASSCRSQYTTSGKFSKDSLVQRPSKTSAVANTEAQEASLGGKHLALAEDISRCSRCLCCSDCVSLWLVSLPG